MTHTTEQLEAMVAAANARADGAMVFLGEAISDMNLESQEDISPRGRDAVAFYQSALRGTKGEQDGK